MTPFRVVALALAIAAVSPRDGGAAQVSRPAAPVPPVPPVVWVQQQDIPDVVRLLAQRAVRAERRGDMETANELFAIIRDMGFAMRDPSAQGASPQGNGGRAGAPSGGSTGWAGRDDDRDDDGDEDATGRGGDDDD